MAIINPAGTINKSTCQIVNVRYDDAQSSGGHVVKKVAAPVKKKIPPVPVGKKPPKKVPKKLTYGLNKKGAPSTAAKIKTFGVEKVYSMISEGVEYRIIAEKIPASVSALMYWLTQHDEQVAYASAREVRANYLAEECISIADQDPGVNEHGATDSGAVAHQRLRVDTRRWITSKMLPTIYGDRQILAGDPKAPLQMKHTADLSNLTEEELALLEKLTAKIGDTT